MCTSLRGLCLVSEFITNPCLAAAVAVLTVVVRMHCAGVFCYYTARNLCVWEAYGQLCMQELFCVHKAGVFFWQVRQQEVVTTLHVWVGCFSAGCSACYVVVNIAR